MGPGSGTTTRCCRRCVTRWARQASTRWVTSANRGSSPRCWPDERPPRKKESGGFPAPLSFFPGDYVNVNVDLDVYVDLDVVVNVVVVVHLDATAARWCPDVHVHDYDYVYV